MMYVQYSVERFHKLDQFFSTRLLIIKYHVKLFFSQIVFILFNLSHELGSNAKEWLDNY